MLQALQVKGEILQECTKKFEEQLASCQTEINNPICNGAATGLGERALSMRFGSLPELVHEYVHNGYRINLSYAPLSGFSVLVFYFNNY